MKWSKYSYMADVGNFKRKITLDNVVQSDHGYIIAVVTMPKDFSMTLALPGKLLQTINGIADRHEDKKKAFGELKAFAEDHLRQFAAGQ